MWKQMLSLPLCFPTEAFKILDIHSPSHPPISSCSPLFIQLYGDAICRPGPGSHHEEAQINRSHHRVPLLPASKRTQGEFVSVILDFDTVQHRIYATSSSASGPGVHGDLKTPVYTGLSRNTNLKVTHDHCA